MGRKMRLRGGQPEVHPAMGSAGDFRGELGLWVEGGAGGWRETLVEGRPMKMCFASVFKPNSASEEIFCCLLRSISSGVSQFTDKN